MDFAQDWVYTLFTGLGVYTGHVYMHRTGCIHIFAQDWVYTGLGVYTCAQDWVYTHLGDHICTYGHHHAT